MVAGGMYAADNGATQQAEAPPPPAPFMGAEGQMYRERYHNPHTNHQSHREQDGGNGQGGQALGGQNKVIGCKGRWEETTVAAPPKKKQGGQGGEGARGTAGDAQAAWESAGFGVGPVCLHIADLAGGDILENLRGQTRAGRRRDRLSRGMRVRQVQKMEQLEWADTNLVPRGGGHIAIESEEAVAGLREQFAAAASGKRPGAAPAAGGAIQFAREPLGRSSGRGGGGSGKTYL